MKNNEVKHNKMRYACTSHLEAPYFSSLWKTSIKILISKIIESNRCVVVLIVN